MNVLARLLIAACAIPLGHAATAGTYTTLASLPHPPSNIYDFTGPPTPLGHDLYGATMFGGTTAAGTIIRITPQGQVSTVYAFRGSPDGEFPYSALVAVGNTLYGTTEAGGDAVACPAGIGFSGCGTVFSLTDTGSESVLYSFHAGADGQSPDSLLAQAGTLYGTTSLGGTNQYGGTAYSLTLGGSKTILHNFGGRNDGTQPNGLTFASGLFYGTTSGGSPIRGSTICEIAGCGTAFRLTPAGTENVLLNFGFTNYDALSPKGLLADGGALYGVTRDGGPLDQCPSNGEVFIGCGTIYRIDAHGVESVLHLFSGIDGDYPVGVLTNVGGVLYGETGSGGANNRGTLFSITPAGVFTTLHDFGAGSDGASPSGGLTYLNGALYGFTESGGTANGGTVFSYTP